MLSKGELVKLLIKKGVIPEGSDKTDVNPSHHLKRLATVGREILALHPEARRQMPKTRKRLIDFLVQLAAEHLQFPKS